MRKSAGSSRIDAVEIGKIDIDFFSKKIEGMDGAVMSAKYALIVTEDGSRIGAGNRNIWSEGTLSKLKDLVVSMENDICADVFGEAPTTDGAVAPVENTSDGVQGL